MLSNILLFCQILISLYSLYISFKNSKYMKQSNWHNSIICYVFLGMISNNIDNIYTKVIITFVMFLILINELNTIKILKNNEEYRLAKEIIEKYNKKAEDYVLKEKIKTQFLVEERQVKKILEMKEYLLPKKDFEKIFKNNKSIVVVGTSYLSDNEKTELIEKAKVNSYELKMLGKDEYIFEKIKN